MKYQRRLKVISKINTPQVNLFELGGDTAGQNVGGGTAVNLSNGSYTNATSNEWYGNTAVQNPDTYKGYSMAANSGGKPTIQNGSEKSSSNQELAAGLMSAAGSLNQLMGNAISQSSIKDPNEMKNNYRNQLGGLDTSSFDALNASKKANIASVTASDFHNMSNGAAVLNGISAGDVGATAGNAIVPGWGALVGGVLGTGSSVVGSIIGRNRARKAVKPMNDFIREINKLNNQNFVNQNNNLLANQVSNLEANYAAEGGFLNMGNNIYKSGGKKNKPDFMKRLEDPNRQFLYDWAINSAGDSIGHPMTHKLGYVTSGDDAIVFPHVATTDNGLYEFQNSRDAFKHAIDNNDTLRMSPSEAEYFTTHYKNDYPGFEAYRDTVIPASYSYGGQLGNHPNDFSNGLLQINNGGSHEMNPYQGVQMGVDPQGTPNLVEEGETVFGDFVFSNRITVPKDVLASFGIKSKKKMTYADVSKYLAKESEERPNDNISQKGLERNLGLLSDAQEKQKLQEDAEKRLAQAMNAVNPNMPADPMMAMQGEEQMQEGQMAQDQMAQEQAMQEQAMQEQMMQEQMAQQGGQPMMMAKGGKIKNKKTIDNLPTDGEIVEKPEAPYLYPNYGYTEPQRLESLNPVIRDLDYAKTLAGNIPIAGSALAAYDLYQEPSWQNLGSLGLNLLSDASTLMGGIPVGAALRNANRAWRAANSLVGRRLPLSIKHKYNQRIPFKYFEPEFTERPASDIEIQTSDAMPRDNTRVFTYTPSNSVNTYQTGGKKSQLYGQTYQGYHRYGEDRVNKDDFVKLAQDYIRGLAYIPDYYNVWLQLYGSKDSDGILHTPKITPENEKQLQEAYKNIVTQTMIGRKQIADPRKYSDLAVEEAISLYQELAKRGEHVKPQELLDFNKLNIKQKNKLITQANKIDAQYHRVNSKKTSYKSKLQQREPEIAKDFPLEPQKSLSEPSITRLPLQKEAPMELEYPLTQHPDSKDFELAPMSSLTEYPGADPDFELESQPRMWEPHIPAVVEKLPPIPPYYSQMPYNLDELEYELGTQLKNNPPEYDIDEDRWVANTENGKKVNAVANYLDNQPNVDYKPSDIVLPTLPKYKPKNGADWIAETFYKDLQSKYAKPGWISPEYNPDHHMIEYYNKPKDQTEYYITPYPESYKDNPNDYFNDPQQVIIDPVNGIVSNFGYGKKLMDDYQGSMEAGNTKYHYKADESLLQDPNFIEALRIAGVDANSIEELEKDPTYKHLTAVIRANPEKWAPFLWSIKTHSGATEDSLDFFNDDGSINYGKFERNFNNQFPRIRFDGIGGIAHWVAGLLKPSMVKKGNHVGETLQPVAEENKVEDKTEGSKLPERRGEFLRYAGVLGDAFAGVMTALSKPNYDNVDDYFKSAKGMYTPVEYNPIGGYLPYKPVDVNKMINDQNANTAATRRALMDVHAGNRGSMSGALTMLNNGHLRTIGDNYIAATEANWKMLQDKEKFNRETESANSEGFLKAAMANQSALASMRDSLYNAYKWKDDIYQKNRIAKVQAYNNLFSDLTEIGKDVMNYNDNVRITNAGGYGNGAQQMLAGHRDYKKDQNADGTWADDTYMNTNQQLKNKKNKKK